jgi:DNA-binding CsgD family transcriptional regulator/catechol 2,3-dioxygenase-like lactoylglutathione lyase family enzyme
MSVLLRGFGCLRVGKFAARAASIYRMTISRDRGRPPHPDVLTPAEWRVAEGVRHGLTNRAIAERQGVTLDAVKFHVANVLSKLGLGRRSDLRRWNGVRVDSNLAIHPPMQGADMQSFELGQVARGVQDIAAATAFFRDVVGLQHLYTFGKLAFFDCAGVRLFLSEGDGSAASLLYFRVAAIHAAQAELEQRGAHFISAPHLIHRHADGTEEWMAFFNDNEQRPLAIMAQVPPL